MSILFKNLSCELGGREILKNISGEIFPGKMTAVLGPNGCGKSTFLRALLGLVAVSGEISAISQQIGYLPQTKEIYWPLTCEAIIELGAKNQGSRTKECTGNVLNRLGIEHLREKRIDEISGGERTLVLLARALRDGSQLIVADEPVSELDPKHQIEVLRILKEEAVRGAIVLVTMHDINLTARFSEDIFLMKEGGILKSGSVEQIITKENLTEIFGILFSTKHGRGLSPDGD